MRYATLFLLFVAACGGSTTDATATPAVATISHLGFSWGGGATPCLGPITMTFTLQVDDAKVGDIVFVTLSGPGLPSGISETLQQSSQFIQKQYSVPKGSGTWTADGITVGGKIPNIVPGASRTAQSLAQCTP